jgi:hypothetical protein
MRFLQFHIRLVLATAGIALAAAVGPTTAGAAGDFIAGVTDSSTGVLRELERTRHDADRFIPGVTDSTTGVLREIEQRREARGETSATSAGGSGVDLEKGVLAGAVAAILAAASLGLVVAGRMRRVAT